MRRTYAAAPAMLCLLIMACSQNGANRAEDIAGVTWTLVEVNGAAVDTAAMNRPATLLLDDEGRASGNAGCNQFGGEYAISGSSLTFGGIAMTRMSCPGRMDVETAYSTVFEATESWRITDGMLELLAGDRILARFRR